MTRPLARRVHAGGPAARAATDGRVALILDVAGLLREALRRAQA